MAKESSDDGGNNKVPKRVYSFAQLFAVSRQISHLARSTSTTNKDVLDSLTKKRKRVEIEGTSGFNCTRETHYSKGKMVLEAATGYPRTALGMVEEAREKKKQRILEIDHFKKMQCFVTLKRLMVHPDGWSFKKPVDGNALAIRDYSDNVSKPLVDLETVNWKLEKGLYTKTDEFARDIRIMFRNAMLYYPVSHEIHKIAMKLSELFETKWKSLEERWAAERAKGEEEKPKPLEKVCGLVTSKIGKKRKLISELSSEENTCPNSMCQAPFMGSALDAELSKEKVTGIAKPKQVYFLSKAWEEGQIFYFG